MSDFVMPSLGADMQSGTLLEWMVKPGDKVARGQTIAVVGTEKGEIDVEVWQDGVIDQLVVKEGVEVDVGAVLATILAEGEVPAAAPVEEAEGVAVQEAAVEKEVVMAGPGLPPPPAGLTQSNGHRIRVSPLARRLAEELGIDLSMVHGTGPHGAISRTDVEDVAAAQAKATAPSAPVSEQASTPQERPAVPKKKAKKEKGPDPFQMGMRRAIAAAMTRSNAEIPHYYLETRIDMRAALAWLEAENLQRSIKDRVLPAVLLIKATALGLAKKPELNGYWIENEFQGQEGINIGFAIALRQGGLITPAIFNADLKGMDELMADMRDLIMRTRSGRLKSSEMTDATVTLTSLGDMGVEKVYGVIYPPQVALIGFGKVAEDVWVDQGMFGVRPVIHATLAGDHRASDGRTGAEFLDIVNKLLQEPEKMWDE
jgi:pyruvate dehydrogenase E2 component (dihydrolipoamide acetyltransferase)